MPDATATFELFDRVVIARDGYSVPLGTRGTIISIQPLVDTNPVRQENVNAVEYFYDVMFDTPFDGAQSIADIADKRLFKVRQSVLLNISHGLGKLTVFYFCFKTIYSKIYITGLNRNAKSNTKRIPQQSPVQQPNQNWRIQKNNGNNNGDNRVEKKDWSALFNGQANERRNNREVDKVTKPNYQQPNPNPNSNSNSSRNRSDEVQKRETNRRYGFKQSIPNLPNAAVEMLNDTERKENWRDEQKPKVTETSLKNIPLPKQFMELSLLEKQTKANLEASAKSNQIKDPSIILQSSSGNSSKDETVVDSSDVLRKLLRISNETPSSPSKESRPFDFLLNKSTPPSAPFPNQIPAKMLPKPPSDWTGKEQKPKIHMLANNQHAFPMQQMPMPMPFMPPFMPSPPQPPFNPNMPNQMPLFNVPMNLPPNHPGMMRPFMHSNVRIGMGPQIAANFNAFPNQMHMHNLKQGPIGPQNLSNNSKHMPGHGAFIPLQAIRKNAKPTKNTIAPSKSNLAKPNKQPPPTEQEIHEKIDQFERQIREETAKEEERKPQQLQPPKKSMNKGPVRQKTNGGNGEMPRPQRLACKFDLPPA